MQQLGSPLLEAASSVPLVEGRVDGSGRLLGLPVREDEEHVVADREIERTQVRAGSGRKLSAFVDEEGDVGADRRGDVV
jgi:hypothetical protein